MRNLFDYMNSGSGSVVASEIIAKVEDTIDEVIAEIKEPIKYEKREYEKRNYDSYYDANDALLEFCEYLDYNGWTIYGYKENRSDSMTDYYDPARWDGIAVKNGFILVMNNKSSGGTISGNHALRSYRADATKAVSKLISKNAKLLALAENAAASKGEIVNSLEMIKRNNEKIQVLRNEYYLDEDTSNPYPANLPTVEYQKNPNRSTWHIERNSKIICKGNGFYKYADLDNGRCFSRESSLHFRERDANNWNVSSHYNEEEWEKQYIYILEGQYTTQTLLDDFMNFTAMLESKVKLVIGDGDEEQLVRVIKIKKEIYYTAKLTTKKTSYVTVGKKWSNISGLTSGKVYKLSEEPNLCYKVTRKTLSNNGTYISSYTLIPNKSTKSSFCSNLDEKIEKEQLSYVELVENFITYEKEEWVKPKKTKTTKTKKTVA